MAMISDLVEGEEHAKERAEAVAMAIVALMVPKKIEGWLARDWIGGNLVFFKEKPTKKRAGMWEDAEGNTGGVLTRYGHDDIDIEFRQYEDWLCPCFYSGSEPRYAGVSPYRCRM